jgi:hypothetical protein
VSASGAVSGTNIESNGNTTGSAENVKTPTGGYKHLGAWGVGRTAIGAILVNTAFYADTAGTATNWAGIPAGTAMLFVQTAAPTGWTKSTTHDNKALRVVSGAASSGGSTAFTSVFTSRGVSGTVGATTLVESQIPSHTHPYGLAATRAGYAGASQYNGVGYSTQKGGTTSGSILGDPTGARGGNGSHTHGFTGTAMDFAVQYVDVIIATKN